MVLHRTYRDLAGTFAGWHQPDFFSRRTDPEVEAARIRFHCRMARRRRREAVAPYLAEPWRAWSGQSAAAAIARRFLARFPDHDRNNPADEMRTERQAAAEYHWDEERNEQRYEDRP